MHYADAEKPNAKCNCGKVESLLLSYPNGTMKLGWLISLGRRSTTSVIVILLIINQAAAYIRLPKGIITHQHTYQPINSLSKPNCKHYQTLVAAGSNDGDQKWETMIEDETGEKIESVKAAVFAAVGGSLAVIPYAILKGAFLHFNADWEFNCDGLLILTAPLFGITYRYAIRRDNNPNLKQGVIGAFVITRAVASLRVSDICTSIPLNCGAPFYLFTGEMLATGLEHFFEAGLCFGGAAYLMETLFKSNSLSKFPKMK